MRSCYKTTFFHLRIELRGIFCEKAYTLRKVMPRDTVRYLAFCDVNEVEAAKTKPGVEKRLLISPEKTPSKRISVEHIVAEPSKSIELRKPEEEMIYFVISGRGTLAVNKVNAEWRFPIESNTAIWIPCDMKNTISNNGEDSLRCLCFSSKLDKKRQGWTELIDQAPSVREMRFNSTCSCSYRFFVRYETLMERGAERFTLCGLAAMPPNGSLAPHVPALGAEEVMYVIQGRGIMTSGKRQFPVKAGSIVYAPPNTMHSVQNTSNNVLQFIFCECLP